MDTINQTKTKVKQLLNLLLIFVILLYMSIANPLTVYADTLPYSGITISTGHNDPINVIIGPDNYLYVAEFNGNRIVKMDKNGQNQTTFATDLTNPIGMVFDREGNLYVTEHLNRQVTKITPSGIKTLVNTLPISGYLTDIVIDSNDKLFVATYANSGIYKMDLDGNNFSTFATNLSPTMVGMTIDSNNNIYVATRSSSKILKVEPNGTVTNFVTSTNDITWVTLDKDGYFYVALDNNIIEKFNSNGVKLSSFSTGTTSPWGLSVDSNGYVYFGEALGNNSSQIRKIIGTASTVSPTQVVLDMNQDISGTQADPSAFTLTGIASNPQVTNAEISGSRVVLTLNEGILSSDANVKLNYTKTGTNDLLVTGGEIEFGSFNDLPVINNVLHVTGVSNIPQNNVAYGTSLENLELPDTVGLNLNNATTISAAIVWNAGSPPYDRNTAGTYTFTGTITTSGNIINPNNVTASAIVVVEENLANNIVSISSIPDLRVQNRTQVGSLSLPSEVTVNLDNATTTGAAIVWNAGSPPYDGNTAGTYTFTGTLDLDGRSDISNTDNLNATINVIVLSRSRQSTSSNSTRSDNNDAAEVFINGKSYTMGTVSSISQNGGIFTSIIVDDKKVQQLLENTFNGSTVSITTPDSEMNIESILNGQTIKSIENKNAILEIVTKNVSYALPASTLNIEDIASQFGNNIDLKDIKVSISISQPVSDSVKLVQDTADKNNFMLVVNPIEFEINCTANGKTIQISIFNSYVERTVMIPDGINPSRITTGVVLNSDGSLTHVPTKIIQKDGKLYAKINSLTNSVYSIIYNKAEFTDISEHWAKDAINDMASRLIINDLGDGKFNPNENISRAEFTASLAKALGLTAIQADSQFNDVDSFDQYNNYINAAVDYKIVTGYSEHTFGPDDSLSREQAMAMITRAMKITGLELELGDGDADLLLGKYADRTAVSDYAKVNVAACLKTGIIIGRGNNTIAPKDYISRAEAAIFIQRLLQKSDLI
jgi:streptogramin lyase